MQCIAFKEPLLKSGFLKAAYRRQTMARHPIYGHDLHDEFHHDGHEIVDMYSNPVAGYQDAHAPQLPPGTDLTDWAKLSKGKTIGKRVSVNFTTTFSGQVLTAPVNMFTLQGEDDNALQLSVIMSPPRVLKRGQPVPTDISQLSTTQDNVELFGNGNGTCFSNAIAILEWGIGGVSHKAEIDILNGMNINVCASYIRIQAGFAYDGIPGFFANANRFVPYEFAAFVGPGKPKDLGAQRTVLVATGLADATESRKIPIPRFAKKVYLLGWGNAADIFVGHALFWADEAGIERNGNTLFQANQPNIGVIPNGSAFLSVLNSSGVALGGVYAIFDLAI
jgi:hypothetical protein